MVIIIKRNILIQTVTHWQRHTTNYVFPAPAYGLFPVGSRSMCRTNVNSPSNGNIPIHLYMAKYSGFKRSNRGFYSGFQYSEDERIQISVLFSWLRTTGSLQIFLIRKGYWLHVNPLIVLSLCVFVIHPHRERHLFVCTNELWSRFVSYLQFPV